MTLFMTISPPVFTFVKITIISGYTVCLKIVINAVVTILLPNCFEWYNILLSVINLYFSLYARQFSVLDKVYS